MLEPRKLMPFSIEYCSAPIAVITEITEKTPMVMPSIVSAERNLFAPSDDHAILMISLNNIFDLYSYLSAVTGSRRDAVQAGANPENKPVNIETIMLTRTRPTEK